MRIRQAVLVHARLSEPPELGSRELAVAVMRLVNGLCFLRQFLRVLIVRVFLDPDERCSIPAPRLERRLHEDLAAFSLLVATIMRIIILLNHLWPVAPATLFRRRSAASGK